MYYLSTNHKPKHDSGTVFVLVQIVDASALIGKLVPERDHVAKMEFLPSHEFDPIDESFANFGKKGLNKLDDVICKFGNN